MSKHTPEPWLLIQRRNINSIIAGGPLKEMHTGDQGPTQIASVSQQDWMGGGEREANARRIVACVNACAGMETKYLESLAILGETLRNRFAQVKHEAIELAEQREQLIVELAEMKQQLDQLLDISMDDHAIANLVNCVRDVVVATPHGAQCLRERISGVLVAALKKRGAA